MYICRLHQSSLFHNFKEIVLNHQFIGDKEKDKRDGERDRKRDLVHRDHELFLIINSSANQALVSSQMRGSIDGRLVVAWY